MCVHVLRPPTSFPTLLAGLGLGTASRLSELGCRLGSWHMAKRLPRTLDTSVRSVLGGLILSMGLFGHSGEIAQEHTTPAESRML